MIPAFKVDAFASRPFTGNPAAVCILPKPAEDEWMQGVAREMNQSETAFLWEEGDGFRLRWFTPVVEVDLCGHATLASAHVLWEVHRLATGGQARFYTRGGPLTAERKGDWIELNFPAEPDEPTDDPRELSTALGVTPRYVGKNRLYHLAEIDSPSVLRNLKPNFGLLSTLPIKGLMVTSTSDLPEYDFLTRFFAPSVGIDEDPVTGSAYSCLGPFWRRRLGKDEFVAYQASARGGVVRVRLAGSRVRIAGQAVTVLRGELAV